jgi:hypothetical protein
MAKQINIQQIYFDQASKANLLEGAIPYYNQYLTEFFENEVIATLPITGDYHGVFSHDIAFEMVFKMDGLPFTIYNLKLLIDRYPSDIYSFQKRRQSPNIVYQADNYHPNFSKYMVNVLDAIGWQLPKRLDFIILFNHFVAKSELYQRYVDELLKPAMEVMKTMPKLYANAGYKKLTPVNVATNWGHYPYHPFLCERLPSIFVQKHIKEIKCKHLF